MSLMLNGDLYVGLPLIVSGLVVLMRQTLLEPDSERYPKAPRWLRMTMFFVAAGLLFSGLQFSLSSASQVPATRLLAFLVMIYNISMLCNVLRQRYSPDTWAKLERINEKLSCNDPDFLRWFSK